MTGKPAHDGSYTLEDGLGVRWIETDRRAGRVEVLNVAPTLADDPAFEQAIRARAARYAECAAGAVASVRRIERDGTALRVVADVQDGIRLSDLLADLEFGNEVLTDAGMLEIAGSLLCAVADLHRLPGGLSHGALTPAHVVITRDGTCVLTDGIFGSALEALQKNREQFWREFGLALPASASLPRFDQRADVTELGALVLALALGRTLRYDEYPRKVADLVIAATSDKATFHASALRMWLQHALQLHSRAVFGSAPGAQTVFGEMTASSGSRRAGSQAVQALIRKRCGTEPGYSLPSTAEPHVTEPVPAFVHEPVPAAAAAPRPKGTFLRTVFSNLRAT